MTNKFLHYSDLGQYAADMGFPAPEHPQLLVCDTCSTGDRSSMAGMESTTVSTDFYGISLKKVTAGEIFYGRGKYDCKNGTMIFTAPRQQISSKGVKVESEGKLICFHEDFIAGKTIQQRIRRCHFFDYAVNEALHLSPREEQQIKRLIGNIEAEYHTNPDEFSKTIVLSLIGTLLSYSERFYRRQFMLRQEIKGTIKPRFDQLLFDYLENDRLQHEGIPKVDFIAAQLDLSPRYLNDALKLETGKTVTENTQLFLVSEAKNLLLGSDASVATIAYQLGFEYPQYFARLFKKVAGLTPTEFRSQIH